MSPGWEQWLKHWESGAAVEWPADDPEGTGAAKIAGFLRTADALDGAGARSRTEYAEPSTPVAASGDCAPALVDSLKSQIAALHLKIAQLEDEHKAELARVRQHCDMWAGAYARKYEENLEHKKTLFNLPNSSWANKWSLR